MNQKVTWSRVWRVSLSIRFLPLFLLLSFSLELLASTATPSSHSSWSSVDDSNHRISRTQEINREVSPFSPGSNNLALDLGQVFLIGDLGKYSDSIGSQLHYTYGVSDLFGFDSGLGYSEHSDGKFSMLSLTPGLRLNMSWYDKVVPYAIFGLGFYKPSYPDNTTATPGGSTTTSLSASSSISAVLFGVHLGPGIDLELNKNLFFGAALTFHNMFGTNKMRANATLLALGGTYTSFFVHIGATF